MGEMEEEVNRYDYSDILHMHCRGCYQTVCSEQDNCVMTRCLYCSVPLHGCKIDDHEAICSMIQVSCPNAGYGCSSKIIRNKIANHLEICPANVVHCGMEWNRYPLYSRERYTLTNIYSSQEGRIKQKREHWVPFSLINPPKIKGQLDTEFAISDQRKLVKEKQKKMAIGKWKISRGTQARKIPQDRINRLADLLGARVCQTESSNECRDIGKNQLESLPKDNRTIGDLSYSRCFSSNQSATEYKRVVIKGCRDDEGVSESKKEDYLQCNISDKSEITLLGSLKKVERDYESQDSVTVEQKEELIQHHYVPKVELQEEQSCIKANHQGMQPVIDLKEEKELIYQVQVQVEDFHSEEEAVVIRNPVTGVPQVPANIHEQLINASTDSLGLNVIVETIPKFQKNYPMYSIPCDVDLRRDQYCSHFKNIHDDIHGGLNYWIQQHCPLAQYGCPYIRHRFKPNSKRGLVVFDHEIDNFGIVPANELDELVGGSIQEYCFDLLSLPLEILEKIALFLDSYSINQFSKACRTTHEICRSLLQRRGIVILEWERGYYSNGSVLWKIRKKKWLFSPSFSEVSAWCFTDEPAMGEHLRTCQFFTRFPYKQRVPLPIADFRSVKLNHEWR